MFCPADEARITWKNVLYTEMPFDFAYGSAQGGYCSIYDKSSILVGFPQMTFVVNFALNWYDLKSGYPSLAGRVTCPTAYFGLALYLRKISEPQRTRRSTKV